MKKQFSDLVKREKQISALYIVGAGNAEYYKHEENFRADLLNFIREDFSDLSTKQLLKLCQLVNRYRVVEPFRFLGYCSNLADKYFS